MDENNVGENSFKAWVLAARPNTLSGAAVPVMLGAAMAFASAGSQVRVVPMALCLLFAFVMQIDANFVNDYYDFIRGNDDDTRLGPKRACAQGWITTKAMRVGIAVTTVLACCIGLPLITYGGWSLLVVGAACVLFCFLYTTCLSYLGMGDLLVLVFFGLVPVSLTYMLAMPTFSFPMPWFVVLEAVACGLVIDTLLMVNNYRDIDNDRRSGKKTMVVMLGHRASELVYLLLGIAAYAVCAATFYDSHVLAVILPMIYLVLHIRTYGKMVKIGRGRELNAVLGVTARNIFLYGLLVSLGMVL